MSDDQPKRPVSEISHLFLSNVRDLTGGGAPRPQRKPPAGQSSPAEAPTTDAGDRAGSGSRGPRARSNDAGTASVDLTPEEFAHVFGPAPAAGGEAAEEAFAIGDEPNVVRPVAPVTALLASHLGRRQPERARAYARQLAGSVGRVGLIELDGTEFRLYCFEAGGEPGAETESRQPGLAGPCDPGAVADALEELNVDVDRWLVLPGNLRTAPARALVRDCQQWVLLTTCDHDGVVSAYRTLKGVADCRVAADDGSVADGRGDNGRGDNVRGDGGDATRLGVAVLDAAGDAEAARVQQKLAGVCRQFMGWDADPEPPVRYAAGVAEHPLMACRVAADGPPAAGGPHWDVVANLVARAWPGRAGPPGRLPSTATRRADSPPAPGAGTSTLDDGASVPPEPAVRRIEVTVEPVISTPDIVVTPAPAECVMPPQVGARPEARPGAAQPPPAASTATSELRPAAAPSMSIAAAAQPAADDVIDLPGEAFDVPGILAAFVRRPEFGMVECPVGVPGCPAGRLAVTRDGGLALVAAASRGLPELRAIGKAFQWMLENRALVAMAVPQLAIDAARRPRVVLLVDQADISADLLAPMMQAEHVAVRAYRTLRWGGRTGLLLDAA